MNIATAIMAAFLLLGICLLVQLIPSDKWNGKRNTHR